MNSFEMKNQLSEALGNDRAEQLVSYIDERTGREFGEERASISATLQEILRRLDRIESRIDRVESRIDRVESRMDSLQLQQVNLIRWTVGVGLAVISLTVTLIKFL